MGLRERKEEWEESHTGGCGRKTKDEEIRVIWMSIVPILTLKLE